SARPATRLTYTTLFRSVAVAALEVLVEERLPERSLELGEYFRSELLKIQNPIIKEVRGKGLFIGMELYEPARPHCERLAEAGLLCKETHENTIRFAPPLTITREELDWAVERIRKVMSARDFGRRAANHPRL